MPFIVISKTTVWRCVLFVLALYARHCAVLVCDAVICFLCCEGLFWQSPKRPPTPLNFDIDNPTYVSLVFNRHVNKLDAIDPDKSILNYLWVKQLTGVILKLNICLMQTSFRLVHVILTKIKCKENGYKLRELVNRSDIVCDQVRPICYPDPYKSILNYLWAKQCSVSRLHVAVLKQFCHNAYCLLVGTWASWLLMLDYLPMYVVFHTQLR